jgi:hypothetical protein
MKIDCVLLTCYKATTIPMIAWSFTLAVPHLHPDNILPSLAVNLSEVLSRNE